MQSVTELYRQIQVPNEMVVPHDLQDLLDACFEIKEIPGWVSVLLTIAFVWSNVATALVVTDLGSVLHMIGGTAASFMIFFLPGLLLIDAAIIKHTTSYDSISVSDSEMQASSQSCLYA